MSIDGLAWLDADEPTGPEGEVGKPVYFRFVIKNTGNVTLKNLVVIDEILLPTVGVASSIDCGLAGATQGSCWRRAARWSARRPATAVSGQYKNLGTATAVAPSGASVSDSDPAHYFGKEVGGCTRTQGYWSTHWSDNAKQYDPTWAPYHSNGTALFLDEPVPDGASTGLSYIQILRASAAGGNAFIILAQQLIAAELNIRAGAAAPPAVAAALVQAAGLLGTDAYEDAVDIPKSKTKQRPVDGAHPRGTSRPVQQRPARAWSLRVERSH